MLYLWDFAVQKQKAHPVADLGSEGPGKPL
jgi:hypothetical protein